MAILFVSGVNDLSTVGIQTDKDGNVVHMTDGNSPVYGRIPFKQGMAAYLVLFGLGVKQRMVNFKRPPSLIFNQIADAETHRGSLQRCAELCESVSSPVINQPKRILHTTRELVSGLLQEIPGVVMPKTMRFQPLSPRAVFEYAKTVDIDMPFIVRVADDLTGKSRVLVRNPDDLALLNALPFDGRDFLLTEFVDFRDNEGLYHRVRLLVVDGEAVLRDALFNSDWKIRAAVMFSCSPGKHGKDMLSVAAGSRLRCFPDWRRGSARSSAGWTWNISGLTAISIRMGKC